MSERLTQAPLTDKRFKEESSDRQTHKRTDSTKYIISLASQSITRSQFSKDTVHVMWT